MDFVVWNARGVGNLKTVAHIKLLVKKYNLLFCAILEPMVPFASAIPIGHKVGLHMAYSNESFGGKIWLLTRDHWDINAIHCDDQSLTFSGIWHNAPTLFH